ncbi:hypothetical protein LTR37_018771 [Vermiconidia calcicola]|uniref:Uncharacterized protein n=1 Tax=Vermiconidia calcicola TaxID=1690605 RepID=A0ACC3MH79_9PEZI|nr:hypothetical protein LTR37_018771 [Vermiconidia calcicola]
MSARGTGGGRGQYYKNRYGGRGRGSPNRGSEPDQRSSSGASDVVRDWGRLQDDLNQIDGSQYGAYKRLLGTYKHVQPEFALSIDHVQGDAYAAPSRVRAIMPWQETGLPNEYLESEVRKIALCDFVTRVAADFIRSKHLERNIGNLNGGWSGPKGGAFNINAPGQEVLPRTSAMISGDGTIELRFTTTLPAAGRTVLGQQTYQILGVNLVDLVRQSLLYANIDHLTLQRHVQSVEKQRVLRNQLAGRGLIAFIANGSTLPRASGSTAFPMEQSQAVPFRSPKEFEITLELPDGSNVGGMGIPCGITLLTGGGFHGKSTLLEAVELGIYDHIPGDGREMVVAVSDAVKIRAEDGRSVSKVDISPFITDLPGGKDTKRFSSDDASGSTSMAANIQEALEIGCKTLLIDEDSSATNLLVRDRRMQSLIKKEPITPLISKARALYSRLGVSTVIVIGGLGDWLSVSDSVIAMDSYVPKIITREAKEVIKQYPRMLAEHGHYGSTPVRKLSVHLTGSKPPRALRKNFIAVRPQTSNPVHDPAEAESGVDLSGLDQLVEVGQSRIIALLLQRIANETASNP